MSETTRSVKTAIVAVIKNTKLQLMDIELLYKCISPPINNALGHVKHVHSRYCVMYESELGHGMNQPPSQR